MESVGSLFIIILILGFNTFISWLNARTVGLVWVEVKHIGGWQRVMAWAGAVMSASGFTWTYLFVFLIGGFYTQDSFLDPGQPPVITIESIQAGFSLGYLIIIPGVLISGLMIWINSLIEAWRHRDLPSAGIAGWNTFAQVHNTYRAIEGIPEALRSVKGFFGGKGGKDKGGMILLLLVVMALLAGILTTWVIINQYAGSRPLPKLKNGEAR